MEIALNAVRIHGGYGYSTGTLAGHPPGGRSRYDPRGTARRGYGRDAMTSVSEAVPAAGTGEVVSRSEVLLPGPAAALGALLDLPVPDLAGGAGLPPLWHWVYLLDHPAQGDLGPDGHPVRGAVPAPPGPGLRRMWAGGSVRLRG